MSISESLKTLSLAELVNVLEESKKELLRRTIPVDYIPQQPQPVQEVKPFSSIKELYQTIKKQPKETKSESKLEPKPEAKSTKIKIQLKLLPNTVHEEIKARFAENTYKSTINSVRKACDITFKTESFDLNKFLENINHFIDCLNKIDNVSSRRTVLGDVLRVMNIMGARPEQIEPLVKLMKDWKPAGAIVASEKEKSLVIPMSEVEDIRERLRKQAEGSSVRDFWHEYLLVSLYSGIIMPQRQKALANSQIVRYPIVSTDAELIAMATTDVFNFVCLNNKKIVLTQYKTGKKGPTCFVFPDSLIKIIAHCHDTFKFKYVIPLKSSPHKPMSSDGITHQLNALVGKNIASNMLRKINDSEKVPVMSTIEKNELAYQAGHSTATQALSYSRYAKA